ncbi:MAG: pre-peptidase C-terminal domain-containing protein [Candidatus Odinarchaeota archaeon]
MNKKCFVPLVLVVFMLFTGASLSSGAGVEVPLRYARTEESYVVDSPHNYPNNYDNTWTIKKDGASRIRVFFYYVNLEANYDYIYVYDSDGTTILETITGNKGYWNHWSPYANGDTIYVRLVSDYSVTYWGFRITKIDYDLGGGGGGGGELTSGQTATSSLSATGATEMWTIDVGANAVSMHSVLNCGSADFDLYGRRGAEPTTSTYDWRGYTSGGEDVTFSNPGAGTWYIMVRSYSGSGPYDLTVTIDYQTGDTTPPTVSITSPANGATVSGTVTVAISATDDTGVTGRYLSIDSGAYFSVGSSYSWGTTSYTDGSHTLRARANDAAGNIGYSSTVTVTVANGGGGGNELTSGVPVSSSLAAQYATEMWTIQVDSDAVSMHSVLTCGSADFDLYGRRGAEPTTSTYDWRGYTSGGEDVTFSNPGAGTWYIMVRSYSGTGPYQLTVTITYGGGGGDDWGTGGKYAIVIGISDYQSISDLSYCDEDATDWYNFLTGKGYEVHVYGDSHSSNYPRYDGLATESNVRAAVQGLAAHAQPGDSVAIMTSGHGGADETNGWYYSGGGEYNTVTSFLCMYDSSSGSSGNYYESEIVSDLGLFSAGVKITLAVDHCHSGGIGPNVAGLSIYSSILMLTTCSGNGYGYDEPTYQNGKFTYWLLQAFSSGQTSWEGAFSWIMNTGRYLPVDNAADNPQIFDGNTGTNYYP